MQATNNKCCPVFYYKEFKSHCPEEMNSADSPFYWAINYWRQPGSNIWYMRALLDKNKIGKLMKTGVQLSRPARKFYQPHSSKNSYILPNGCRGSCKFEEPRFLQSSVCQPSAENVLNFKPLQPRKHSDINSMHPQEHHFVGESFQRCQ